MKKYVTLLKIAADSPAELRKGDVMRVIENAATAGFMMPFADWLRKLRPDLTEEIVECIGEVNGWTREEEEKPAPVGVHFAHWFAAVRKRADDGTEWVDISTVNVIGSQDAMIRAAEGNKKAGQSWAKDNPVVRLIRLECQEVPGSALPPIGRYIA